MRSNCKTQESPVNCGWTPCYQFMVCASLHHCSDWKNELMNTSSTEERRSLLCSARLPDELLSLLLSGSPQAFPFWRFSDPFIWLLKDISIVTVAEVISLASNTLQFMHETKVQSTKKFHTVVVICPRTWNELLLQSITIFWFSSVCIYSYWMNPINYYIIKETRG